MSTEQCPTEQTLMKFNEGRLPLEEIDDVANHLGDCPACVQRLEQVSPGALEESFRLAVDVESKGVEPRESIEVNVGKVLESVARPQSESKVDPNLGSHRFELKSEFQQTSLADYYHAVDLLTHEPTLVAFPSQTFTTTADHRSQLRDDLRNAAKLRQPNIVPIIKQGIWSGQQLFFAMPHLNFHSLADCFSEPSVRIDFHCLLTVIGQICSAVDYAHENEVIHRHLSPSKILVQEDLHLWIHGFGLLYDGRYQFGLIEPLQDASEFCSPESVSNVPTRIDHRTDVYSIGAILHWLLDRSEDVPTNVFDALTLIAQKCKRKSRGGRFQSISQLTDSIGGSLAALPKE